MVARPIEHPYIEADVNICGGEPVIRGTRMPVRTIVGFTKLGKDVDEIAVLYPHLSHAQLYDALSYYYDHREEVEESLRRNSVEYQLEETAGEPWRERSYTLTKT